MVVLNLEILNGAKSKGCSLDVALGGQEATFMLLNFPTIVSGWQPALLWLSEEGICRVTCPYK